MRRATTLGTAAALALALPPVARAQAVTGVVTGAAAGDDGRPLAYARVVLAAAARPDSVVRQVLAGADGRFVLVGVAPGRYRVQVRQIGYRPAAAEVAVGDAGAAPVQVRLTRVPVALPAAVVRGAPLTCDAPEMRAGRDDPQLAALRDALAENAERYALLLRQYPIEVRAARRSWDYTTDGTPQVRDTSTTVAALAPVPYAPGAVLAQDADSSGRPGGVWRMRVPNLADLAGARFAAAHCVAFGGETEVDGRPAVRLLVAPERHVRTPDVVGVFYLDAATRVLRRSELTLTRVPPGFRVTGVVSTDEYAEVLPGLPVRRHALLTQAYVPPRTIAGRVVDRSAQRVDALGYRFTGAVPPGAAAGGTLPAAAQ